jgi:hypothetical protein
MTKTAGSSDKAQRTRRPKTDSDKDATKSRKDEKKERERKRNFATFSASLYHTAPAGLNEPPAMLDADLAAPTRQNDQPDPPAMLDGDHSAPAMLEAVYTDISLPVLNGVIQDEEMHITADLDIEGEDTFEDAEEAAEKNEISSVMREYLLKIQKRIKTELSDKTMDKWLLVLLRNDEWWIEVKRAKQVCKKLDLNFSEPSYYRDVRVWFPEKEFGQNCMPTCVSCNSNAQVAVHGYFNKSPARRVVSLQTHYYVMSRRYICHTCKSLNQDRKKIQYTFMGYNSKVLENLPDGKGDDFPAFLTHQSAVDKLIVNLQRPLHDKGVRPHALSEMLLELHSKRYYDDYIKRERLLAKKKLLNVTTPADMFSTFADKSKYNGAVPTGKYLASVYNKYGESLHAHYDREVKKRGCDQFNIDASYKAPKHLCQHHGKPIFNALVTATNRFRETRLQQLAVTDGHDQLRPALRAMLDTMTQYGQPHPTIAFTDNVLRDRAMLVEEIKSLQVTQKELDEFSKSHGTSDVFESNEALASPDKLTDTAPAPCRIDRSHMSTLPDLNARLTPEEAMEGLVVDIVPSHGYVPEMATRGALGTMTNSKTLISQDGFAPKYVRANGKTSCIVEVTKVYSPSLLVPGMKKNGVKACLGDCGDPPFRLVFPLKMLKKHVESDHVRNYPDRTLGLAPPGVTPPAATAAAPSMTTNPTTEPAEMMDEDDGEVLTNTDPIIEWDADILAEARDDAGEDNPTIFDSVDEERPRDEEMDPTNLELIECVELLAAAANSGNTNGLGNTKAFICDNLDDPPDSIEDNFSAVVGDSFHKIKRPYVPIEHEVNKPFWVALMRAWFCWNEKKLENVIRILKENGWDDEDVKNKMYYKPRFFQELVERRVLPPRQLYWRVRAVYVKFGNRIDAKSKKPLFNKNAWKTANSVLKEILRGEASDPPGFNFYTQRLNAKGEPKTNSYGIQLLDCHRGTSDVENQHKQYVTTFGTWHTGVETSCTLLRERRHRHNDRMSQKYRVGYPKIGHYDTWKVDLLQIMVEQNHGVLLFPYWVNANDFKDTNESFDIVALQSTELHEAVNNINLDPKVLGKLSSELKFVAKGMGVPLPFLPVHGKEEMQLFVQLILTATAAFNADEMALQWCNHVNGVTIFPKLPVYLREYHVIYLKNKRVKDAVKSMKSHVELLEVINKELVPEDLANTETEDCAMDGIEIETEEVIAVATAGEARPVASTGWQIVPLPSVMPRAELIARRPLGIGPPVVGGTAIGFITEAPGVPLVRSKGQRGKDTKQRSKRSCKRCKQNDGPKATTCRGRNGGSKGGVTACQHFGDNGESRSV